VAKIKLTRTAVETAQPEAQAIELRDTLVPGFLCKITPAGRRVFMLQYRTNGGERRKPSLGLFGELTVEQARALAQEWLAHVRRGGDPAADKAAARTAPTVKELCTKFMEDHSKQRNKPSTQKGYWKTINNNVIPLLGRMKVQDVKRPDIAAAMKKMAHKPADAKPLRLAFEAGKLHSFILWGPPSVGKTTLGRLAASATDSRFIAISAVLAGVKDIRQAIDEAQAELDNHGRSTVLFVNEIHRFNKAQQDALLPHVESGLLTLVGGTTEHPGLAVNSALLSRAQVYTLEPLCSDELNQLYERALPHLKGVTLDADALDLLKGFADGDGRAWRGRAGTSQRTGASSEGWEKGLLGCARSMTRRRQARTLY